MLRRAFRVSILTAALLLFTLQAAAQEYIEKEYRVEQGRETHNAEFYTDFFTLFSEDALSLVEAEQRAGPRPMPRWGLALAAGLMAAGILIGLQMGRGLPDDGLPAAPAAGAAAVTAASFDSLSSLRAAEADFLRATETLLAELEARRDALPPAAVTTVEENLVTIRSSIDEVWGALEADPDSLRHASRLVGLYRTQMDLLQRTVQSEYREESL